MNNRTIALDSAKPLLPVMAKPMLPSAPICGPAPVRDDVSSSLEMPTEMRFQ
jgi:hypothetical protein